MDEKITVEFSSVEELNTVVGLLGQLPYVQVFQILDAMGKQAGPQIRAIEEERAKLNSPSAEETKED